MTPVADEPLTLTERKYHLSLMQGESLARIANVTLPEVGIECVARVVVRLKQDQLLLLFHEHRIDFPSLFSLRVAAEVFLNSFQQYH